MTAILSAAISTGAQAIHPGFGFLSENAEFVSRCEECGIVFIGPKSETIEKMGDKAQARETAMRAKVPVVPGSEGIITDLKEAKELAKRIKYPVLIKAVSGGGGKGMRIVEREIDLEAMIKAAQMEAQAAFGDETVYMEKFIVEPKHIEFQILADHYGHVVHLGERDCSVQRRNQKMIEEAPSVFLDEKLRARMGNDAVKLAKNVKYRNAGTIEFLVDKEGNYYFIEMNTRIQVEHPVTEMITGIDLVKEQIRIAAGEELPFTQKSIQIKGHAIECRINAEDPEHDFRPSPGKISTLVLPGGNGVRIDSAVYQGYTVPPTYDSMIAKLIVYGQDREEALAKMRRALEEFIIFDIKNNIDFQYSIINHPSFILGNFDTSFIAKQMLAKNDRKEK